MDLKTIKDYARNLRDQADEKDAYFGLYQDAHEEDVFVKATTDGVLLFVADLLEGIGKTDNPLGQSLIALKEDTPYHDKDADLHLHAIELYGKDVKTNSGKNLQIAKVEYFAILGCLIALVVTTIFSMVGVFIVGQWLWNYFF